MFKAVATSRFSSVVRLEPNLFNFFHHKEKPQLNNTSIVSRTSDNYVVVIDKPIKSILKTKNERLSIFNNL